MRRLKVTISGEQGSGKTTLATRVYQALKAEGIEVVLSGEDRYVADRLTLDQAPITEPMQVELTTRDETL